MKMGISRVLMSRVLIFVMAFVGTGRAQYDCLPGITKYSKHDYLDGKEYYECEKAGDKPVWKKCPDELVYWTEGARCVTEAKRRRYEQPAAVSKFRLYTSSNRAFSLTQRKIGDNFSLVNLKTIFLNVQSSEFVKEISTHQLFETINQIFEGATAVEKLQGMGLSDQRMLDILLEMQDVSNVLFNFLDIFTLLPAPSADEIVVNLRFEHTTLMKNIAVNNKTKSLLNYLESSCEDQEISHIVTGNYFGDFGYFEFRRKLLDREDRQEVTKFMKKLVQSVYDPNVVMSAKMKNVSNSMTVKYFGYDSHIVVSKDIGGYEGAKEKYKLKKEYSKNHPNSTYIIAVDLTPITDFCNNTEVRIIKPNREIRNLVKNIVIQTRVAKRDIEAFDRELKNWIAEHGKPGFSNEFLGDVQKESSNYLSGRWELLYSLRNLGRKMQGIGSGTQGEEDLLDLLAYEQHKENFYRYFHQHVEYMSNRRKELDIIKQLINDFVPVGSLGSRYLKESFERPSGNFLMLELNLFYSTYYGNNRGTLMMENNERYKRKVILQKDSSSWFNKPKQVEGLRKAVKRFKRIAEFNKKKNQKVRANYLISLMRINKELGSESNATSIIVTKDNDHGYRQFNIPSIPSVLDKQQQSITVLVRKPKKSRIQRGNRFHIEYWQSVGHVEERDVRLAGPYKFQKDRSAKVKLSNLKNGTAYQFRVQYNTTLYGSVFSDVSEPVDTDN